MGFDEGETVSVRIAAAGWSSTVVARELSSGDFLATGGRSRCSRGEPGSPGAFTRSAQATVPSPWCLPSRGDYGGGGEVQRGARRPSAPRTSLGSARWGARRCRRGWRRARQGEQREAWAARSGSSPSHAPSRRTTCHAPSTRTLPGEGRPRVVLDVLRHRISLGDRIPAHGGRRTTGAHRASGRNRDAGQQGCASED
jgi:hypothetical protein